ncbi:MAG: antitoxin Xre-like helix-turn-helix domain-containing protein [Bacteroidota bacterium]
MESLALPDLREISLDRLDGRRLLDLEADPVRAVREGVLPEAFDRLQDFLDVSASTLAEVLDIAPRTLARRRQTGDRLKPEESDRLLRTARVAELALAVFEEASAAATWFTAPNARLGGETPLARTDTAPGAREVEAMLFAIEFSSAA